MAFEIRSVHDVINIAGAGGGFKMNANAKDTNDLVLIAIAASRGGARVTFTGIANYRSTDDLLRIAKAGAGAVTFED